MLATACIREELVCFMRKRSDALLVTGLSQPGLTTTRLHLYPHVYLSPMSLGLEACLLVLNSHSQKSALGN